jgi:hypothetical protein
MASHDLDGGVLPHLDWNAPDPDPLTVIWEHTIGHATKTEGWYAKKRSAKRIGGQVLRVGSIALAAAAALIPILAELWTDDGDAVIPPGWASAALILAASLIVLDRYFGFSTGWTRFMVTELKVARIRHDFEYAWEETISAPGDENQKRSELLRLARGLAKAIDDEVEHESEIWSSEFQASLDATAREMRRMHDPRG